MSKKCPKCGNETFIVRAHVVQTWEVDRDGDYLKVIEECDTVAHYPDNDDLWTCSSCGYDASGDKFEAAAPAM